MHNVQSTRSPAARRAAGLPIIQSAIVNYNDASPSPIFPPLQDDHTYMFLWEEEIDNDGVIGVTLEDSNDSDNLFSSFADTGQPDIGPGVAVLRTADIALITVANLNLAPYCIVKTGAGPIQLNAVIVLGGGNTQGRLRCFMFEWEGDMREGGLAAG